MNASTLKAIKRTDSILRMLREQPRTVKELAVAQKTAESNIWVYINRMRKATPKQVYICRHKTNTGIHAGRPAPVFAAGGREDVEFVPLNIRGTKISMAERCERVIELLTAKKMTTKKLAETMHLSDEAVRIYLKRLRREKKVYIAKYQNPRVTNPEGRGSSWAPIFGAGSRPDAPAPKKETYQQRHARLQKDPVYIAAQNKRRRHRYELAQIRKKPQNIFSALGL